MGRMTKEQLEYYNIYMFLIDNKNLDYDSFVEKLKKHRKLSISELITTINDMEDFPIDKIKEMNIIIKYIFSKKLNDEVQVRNLQKFVDKINLPEVYDKSLDFEPDQNTIRNRCKTKIMKDDYMKMFRDEYFDYINSDNNERKSSFTTRLKCNLKYFTDEEYLNFLDKTFNIEPFTKEELLIIKDYLLYNRNSLESKLGMLEFYHDTKDKEKIKLMSFYNDNSTKEEFKKKDLYSWEKRRMSKLISLFDKLYDVLDDLEKNRFFKEINLSVNEMNTLKNDYPEINEFYLKYKSDWSVLERHVLSLDRITDERRKKLVNAYNLKYVKGDNE